MFNALRFLGWPLLVGLLVALLIIQRYPQLVGLKEHNLGLQQAPLVAAAPQQGPYSYANAVAGAAPAVANLYTTKVIERPSSSRRYPRIPCSSASSATTCQGSGGWSPASAQR